MSSIYSSSKETTRSIIEKNAIKVIIAFFNFTLFSQKDLLLEEKCYNKITKEGKECG